LRTTDDLLPRYQHFGEALRERTAIQRSKGAFRKAQVVSTSRVGYVEVQAVLAQKLRQGEVSEERYRCVLSDFEMFHFNPLSYKRATIGKGMSPSFCVKN
jgi:hypothetical protein